MEKTNENYKPFALDVSCGKYVHQEHSAHLQIPKFQETVDRNQLLPNHLFEPLSKLCRNLEWGPVEGKKLFLMIMLSFIG